MTEFKVPELGENVSSGDVSRVLVNVGDTLSRDQPVLELETDKATIEVPSSVAGVIKDIKVKKGDTVNVGAVVLTVDDSASGNGDAAPAGKAAQRRNEEAPQSAEEAPAQQPADDRKAAAPGRTAAGQGEGRAASGAEGRAGGGGEGRAQSAAEGRAQSVGEGHKVLSMPARQGAEPAPAAAKPSKGGTDHAPAAAASPAVRRLAREIGVEVSEIQGSGPAGRISQEDVKEHARRILSSVGAAGGSAAGMAARAIRPLPSFEKWGAVERQPWSNIRRTTAEHLAYAWTTVPHVTQCDKADITGFEELRKKYRERIAEAGGNLTVTAMLVHVLATAVKHFPQFNASLDAERGEIVYKKYVHVGVAVDTDRGLLVPVIRDADRKNVLQISIELQQAAEKARERKLTLDEMSGGGITISNLGGIGGTYFTPIVNWPEVAILGVSRAAVESVWLPAGRGAPPGPLAASGGSAGAFEPRQMLPLSLSYDHRVIDGADAMRFLRWVVEAIEQPVLLSLIG